jgi:hypothetical protein
MPENLAFSWGHEDLKATRFCQGRFAAGTLFSFALHATKPLRFVDEDHVKETFPQLFIIESLNFDNERDGHLEGGILRDILRLSLRDAEYMYIRTQRELEVALEHFQDSGKRYLHLSCHGNDHTVSLTLDHLSFMEFGNLVKPFVANRRLFISACEVVNPALAAAVLPGSDCYSLVGSRDKISLGDSAMMWASFYHLMLRDPEQEEIKGGKIRWGLRRLKKAFGVEFDYFKPVNNPQGYEKVDIEAR